MTRILCHANTASPTHAIHSPHDGLLQPEYSSAGQHGTAHPTIVRPVQCRTALTTPQLRTFLMQLGTWQGTSFASKAADVQLLLLLLVVSSPLGTHGAAVRLASSSRIPGAAVQASTRRPDAPAHLLRPGPAYGKQ